MAADVLVLEKGEEFQVDLVPDLDAVDQLSPWQGGNEEHCILGLNQISNKSKFRLQWTYTSLKSNHATKGEQQHTFQEQSWNPHTPTWECLHWQQFFPILSIVYEPDMRQIETSKSKLYWS